MRDGGLGRAFVLLCFCALVLLLLLRRVRHESRLFNLRAGCITARMNSNARINSEQSRDLSESISRQLTYRALNCMRAR